MTGSLSGWHDLLIDLDWLEQELGERLNDRGEPTRLEPGTVLLIEALKRAGIGA